MSEQSGSQPLQRGFRSESLRDLAVAADRVAPSPWRYDGRDLFCKQHGSAAHHLLLPIPETWHESQRPSEEVLRFIAACDPLTILALIAALSSEDATRPTGDKE